MHNYLFYKGRKQMKKLMSGFITVAALLTLAACGNGGSSSTDSSKKGDQNQLEAISLLVY